MKLLRLFRIVIGRVPYHVVAFLDYLAPMAEKVLSCLLYGSFATIKASVRRSCEEFWLAQKLSDVVNEGDEAENSNQRSGTNCEEGKGRHDGVRRHEIL